MIISENPYTEEEIGRFEETSVSGLDRRLLRAQVGFARWRKTTFDDRTGFLQTLSTLLREKTDRYAALISREMGKVIGDARKEVNKSAMALDFFARHGKEYLEDEVKKTKDGEGVVMYQPLGVALGIMPWNYPFWQFFRFAATTLMAGNTIVLKHSTRVPVCCMEIEKIFEEACFPGGVFQNLWIRSGRIENIIKDFRVQAASLTGGIEAGSEVAVQAGKHIKKVVLELDGSGPFIVMEDADVQSAAEAAASSRMKNFGQSCDAAERFIIHQDIADEFMQAFSEAMSQFRFGDPLEESSDFACLASRSRREKLESQVEQSIDKGARVFWKGDQVDGGGAFFNPMIQAGIVYINDEVHSRPEMPFGGVKKSGIGHEMATVGAREFTNRKSAFYPSVKDE